MTDTLARIESEVCALREREDMTIEVAARLITDIDTAVRRARDAKAALEAFLIDWLPLHGGEVVIGTVRYFVTDRKKVKCKDLAGAFKAVLDESGGDIDLACECLSSDALKHGAVRKVLGPRYDLFFETTYEADVDSKPVKQLARLDGRFANQGSSNANK